MITIHQATFGESVKLSSNYGYGLLQSSFSSSDIPQRIGGHTDLVDRPPDSKLKHAIIRAFSVENYFLLIKSFPDFSSSRSGRIFSHVLFIEEKDLQKLSKLSPLLSFHLSEIDKELALDPFTVVNPSEEDGQNKLTEGRLISAINAVSSHENFDNAIIWIEEEGYWEWVDHVWSAIPTSIKMNCRLGAAFNPSRINKNLLNLLYMHSELKSNWVNTNYKLIEFNANEKLNSYVAHFLAGNDIAAKDLKSLISDFKLQVNEIDDLTQFEKLIPIYKAIHDGANIKSLLKLADIVSKYNPNANSATKAKKDLFKSILSRLASAKAEEVKILANPDWSGFKNAENKLAISLQGWLDENLFKQARNLGQGDLLIKALETDKEDWWIKAVKKSLLSKLVLWQPSYALSVWQWFETTPSLIKALGAMLPSNSEKDLAENLPPKLNIAILNSLANLAKDKSWLEMHGLVSIQLYPLDQALSQQLAIDTNKDYYQALEQMANKAQAKAFIAAIIDFEDDRLYKIAARLCHTSPKLLSKLDIKQNGWQKLWYATTHLPSFDLWSGFKNPTKKLFDILDYLIGGREFNEKLLLKISESSFNDLSSYSKRKEIWTILPLDVKQNFLSATAQSCLKKMMKKKQSFEDVEKSLYREMNSQKNLRIILKDSSFLISSKLALFKQFSTLDQSDAIYMIDNNHFSNSDAILLGQNINNFDWQKTANYIYKISGRRNDLRLTLRECVNLFGFMERFYLSWSGISSNQLSQKDYLDILRDRAIDLYPSGPDQNGLWERSGGDNADLVYGVTGKKRWHEAIRNIKNGGKPTMENLLDTILSEFNDDALKNLKRIL